MTHATREKLIETGLAIMREKGFNHTGLQEILQQAGVPKGSFYHFFSSKEDFGEQVLEFYAQGAKQMAESILLDSDTLPLERLRRFFKSTMEGCRCDGFRGGCLIGNLSQELADQNPAFAKLLARKFAQQRELIRENLAQAQADGTLSVSWAAGDLADFLINSWQGAMLRMKVNKSCLPLDQFMDVTFNHLLT